MCAVDTGVKERELDEEFAEQYRKPDPEEPYRKPEPEEPYREQELPEGFEDDKFNLIF